jgi:hypothetical protein
MPIPMVLIMVGVAMLLGLIMILFAMFALVRAIVSVYGVGLVHRVRLVHGIRPLHRVGLPIGLPIYRIGAPTVAETGLHRESTPDQNQRNQ